MNKICYGCGCKLQSEDETKEGYIPKTKEDAIYCMRCFKIMHYGIIKEEKEPKTINNIVKSINQDNRFVIFLIDFLNINSKVINIYKKIRQNKLLLISKSDIIPKSINKQGLIKYLKDYYNINEDIKFISHDLNNASSLINYLKYHNIKDTYVVGLSNAGKSTLINNIISLTNNNIHNITTSYMPNTTSDFIRININNDLMLIDSPGFIIPSINDLNIIKKNNLKTYLKPKTFQMKKDEILCIENIYLKFNANTSITLYISNNLIVKKYYKEIEKGLIMTVSDNCDLIITGLGFINIKKGSNIEIVNIPIDVMEIRPSIFGGE